MESSNSQWWLVGVALNVCGSVVFNLSVNLLKLAGSGNTKSPCCPRNPHCLKRVAILLLILGSALAYMSFAFTSSSLLASLGGVQLLVNLVFSQLHDSHRLTLRHYVATLLLVVGMLISAVYSTHATRLYSANDLVQLYLAPHFLLLESVLFTFVIFHHFWLERHGRHIALSSAFHSAIVGTGSVLHAKVLAEILKLAVTTHSWRPLYCPLFLIVGVLCIFNIAYWMHRLSRSIHLFPGNVIIPLLQVAWVLCASLQGGVFFNDFETLSMLHRLYFCLGLLITVTGIFVLTSAEQRVVTVAQFSPLKTSETTTVASSASDQHLLDISRVALTVNEYEAFESGDSTPESISDL